MTLGYLERGLVQGLAAYAVVSTLGSLAVWWLARRRLEAANRDHGTCARHLFGLRMAPSMMGLVCGGLLVPAAFVLWEPAHEGERVGIVALGLAALGAALLASGLARAVAALVETRALVRRLGALASRSLSRGPLPGLVIESDFPIVALVGIVTPRVMVARSVMESCTGDELRAVLAHEQAHADRHDNLRRLMLAAAPDLLAWLPMGPRIGESWARVAELAADAEAARHTSSPLDLASALVKVARLAVAGADPLPASALYRGEQVTERVRSLLEPRAPQARSRRWPRTGLVALVAAASAAALPLLHLASEALFRLGS